MIPRMVPEISLCGAFCDVHIFNDNDVKVDPAMMAALMAACSVIQTGANTEEVNFILIHEEEEGRGDLYKQGVRG